MDFPVISSAPGPEIARKVEFGCRAAVGVVLAGGRNSRMGGIDKAFMRVGGEPCIVRILTTLRSLFSTLVVVTNRAEKYRDFRDVLVVEDLYSGRGPLAALYTGFRAVDAEAAFVVACDMPFLRPEPVRYLARYLPGRDAVIPCWEGDVEPLHGFYARSVLPCAETLLEEGGSGIRALLARVNVHYVSEAEMAAVPGAEESFRNVNTPADAQRFAVELRAES